MLNKLFHYCYFFLEEIYHLKKIKNFLKKNYKFKFIYDIGAHRGKYSLLFDEIFTNSEVFAFEPDLRNYEYLIENIKKKTNIKPFNIAITERKGSFFLKRDQFNHYTSTLSEINFDSKTFKLKKMITGSNIDFIKKNKIEIKGDKLDNFIKKNNLPFPDFIKIDVEGHELQALNGMLKILKNKKIVLMIEIHNDDLYKNKTSDVNKLLKKLGFKLIKRFKFPFMKWEDCIYRN